MKTRLGRDTRRLASVIIYLYSLRKTTYPEGALGERFSTLE